MKTALRRQLWLVTAFALSTTADAVAQQRVLTIDDIYDPSMRVNFSGNSIGELSWIDGTRYLQARTAGSGLSWIVVDAASGAERPLFDASRMEAALSRIAGVSAADARRAAGSRALTFNNAYSAALASIGSDLYAYSFADDRAVR